MALTAAQLNTIYQNVLFRNVDTAGIQFFANRTDISDAQVRQQIELSGEANQFISPIVRLYQTVLGRVPDQDGLRFFSFQLRQGTSLEAVTGVLLNSAEFQAKTTATAGSVDTTDLTNTNQLVSDTFQAILGRAPAPGELTFFQGRSAASILSLVAGSPEATQVNAANTLTFLDSVAQGSYPTGTLNNQTGGVGGGTNAGTIFTLTAGVDAGSAFTGTSGNDTFNAGDVNGAAVFTAGDQLNGGAGTDTLNITQGTAFAGIPAGASISNIETINVISGSTVAFDATAGNVTGVTALNVTAVNGASTVSTVTAANTTDTKATVSGVTGTDAGVTVNGGRNVQVTTNGGTQAGDAAAEIVVGSATASATGTVAVTNNTLNGTDTQRGADVAIIGGTTVTVNETATGNAVNTIVTQGNVAVTGTAATTSVTVNQTKAVAASATVAGVANGEVTITDVNAASNTAAGTIATVSLNSYGNSTIDSSALTTVNLAGSGGSLGIGRGDLTAVPTANTLALNVSGLTAGAITDNEAPSDDGFQTINIASTGTASTISALAAVDAKAINVSGDAKLTISGNTLTSLESITVTNTGGFALTGAINAGATFTGGAGADAVTLTGGFTKAITLGAGNDTLTYGGAAGTGGSVNAGDGIDTIVMTATQADAADNDAVFNSKFTGFEALTVTSPGSETINLVGINGVNNVSTAGATNLTLNGFGANGTLTLTNDSTQVNVGVTNATFNPSDVFNLNLSNDQASARSFGIVDVAGVETVNINTVDAGTGTSNTAATIDTLTLRATGATSIVVAGNNGLTITNTNNAAVTSFNASGVVANSANDTAANLAVTFTSANNTASANVSITGGAGNDVLTGGAAKDTIIGGAGNDSLFGAAGIDTLNGGDGDDFIDGGADADILTGGAGNDTFVVSNLNNVTATTTLIVDTITDLNFGVDRIAFDKAVTAVTTIDTPITATNLLGAAQSALATIGASASADVYKAGTFSFNGDTYLLVNDNNTTLDTTDFLVKVTNSTGTLSVNSFGNLINGTDAANTLNGTANADIINGFGGTDAINGLAGNDTLTGGEGTDTITGGTGNDTINLTETTPATDTVVFEATAAGNGVDAITGFKAGTLAGGGDVLNVQAFIGATVDATAAASTLGVTINAQDINLTGGDGANVALVYNTAGTISSTNVVATGTVANGEIILADNGKAFVAVATASTATSANLYYVQDTDASGAFAGSATLVGTLNLATGTVSDIVAANFA